MVIVEALVLLYFVYVVSYTFVFSFAGLFYRNPTSVNIGNKKFAVFIPAYKEDSVIVGVAQRALKQTYPSAFYDVIIIADSLQPATLENLRALPIRVVEVKFESSTKVKSLNEALRQVPNDYDFAVILDADNVMAEDFLARINGAHQAGLRAIQGQRIPKNTNSTLSFLDGLSEAINNHIYRQGTTALGLSASINGSGVSFEFSTFKRLLSGMNSIGGFDRELELLLLENDIKVIYYKDAKVMDEKVEKTAVFENQRKRWISSQYHYLAKYFNSGLSALLRGNFTYFNSSVLRNIQLPRLINLGLLGLLPIALFFLREFLFFGYVIWPCLLLVMVIAMFMAIPGEYYSKELIKAIFKLPGLFIRMFLLLFKLKGANKKFIHTPHGTTSETSK
jgi:cellulose synthase/poly-beta-1,6-N-acetylglucosamine synthase-like glycosyltransferase